MRPSSPKKLKHRRVVDEDLDSIIYEDLDDDPQKTDPWDCVLTGSLAGSLAGVSSISGSAGAALGRHRNSNQALPRPTSALLGGHQSAAAAQAPAPGVPAACAARPVPPPLPAARALPSHFAPANAQEVLPPTPEVDSGAYAVTNEVLADGTPHTEGGADGSCAGRPQLHLLQPSDAERGPPML